MSAKILMSAAAGGALGSVGRYLMMVVMDGWLGGRFPVVTLLVNVTGAAAMGVLIAASALVWTPSPEVRAFLLVGVLGAFTTFSLFSLDLYTLVEAGEGVMAGVYATASVLLCMAGFYGGYGLLRQMIA